MEAERTEIDLLERSATDFLKNQNVLLYLLRDEVQLATTKTVLSSATSVATTAMVVHSMASNLLPSKLRSYITNGIHNTFLCFSSEITLIIDEFDGLVNN